MTKASSVLISLMLFFGMARAEDEGKVSIAGAFAEIGWDGHFSSGGWVEFRLVATGGGAFTALLETSEGKVLEGLTPISAKLELNDGAGTRQTRLILPITSTRLVKISLTGATGTATKRFAPSSQALELDGSRLPLEPSLYLAGHTILGRLEPSAALAALAGGASLPEAPVGLPRGNLGLGAVEHSQPPLRLLQVLAKLAPEVAAPSRRHEALAFWCVAAFVVLLGLYGLKRHHVPFIYALAGSSLGLAGVGWWAIAPQAAFNETSQVILVGASGWGTKWVVHSRYCLRAEWTLPAGALPLEGQTRIARSHSVDGTTLTWAGWQKLRYLTAPTATRIPMRLERKQLINDSQLPLEKIFVRGYGRQEPLAVGAKRGLQARIYETLPWDEYTELLQVLPDGAVIAQQNKNMIVALPEETKP